MNKKLTLSLDSKVIKRTKIYAEEQGSSLSDLVENYFRLLTSDIQKEEKNKAKDGSKGYSPIEKYKGAFHLPDDRDYKDILTDELWKKHMK